MTLREYLSRDFVGDLERRVIAQRVKCRFGNLLYGIDEDLWLSGLSLFVENAPLHYWDHAIVMEALALLSGAEPVSAAAASRLAGELGIAFDNIFRPSPAFSTDSQSPWDESPGYVRTTTVFLPEYHRLVEFAFDPFARIVWASHRRKQLPDGLNLCDAASNLRTAGHGRLVDGYDPGLRNAIAHGQVQVGGLEMAFTPDNKVPIRLTPSEFVERFDLMWRTSLSLAVALTLFLLRAARQEASAGPLVPIPDSLRARLCARRCESSRLRVVAVLPSEPVLVGKQLHINLTSATARRGEVLRDAARVAMHLVDGGVLQYDRFAISVDCGRPSSCFVALRPQDMLRLLELPATAETIGELFRDGPLLWHDENRLMHLGRLALSGVRAVWAAQTAEQTADNGTGSTGREAVRNRYYVRDVKIVESGSITTKTVLLVLRRREDSANREILTEVATSTTMVHARRAGMGWVGMKLFSGRGRRVPNRVHVKIYSADGPLKWLGSQGWASGNLACVAEWVDASGVASCLVPLPETEIGGIRIRFSAPAQAAFKDDSVAHGRGQEG